MRCFAFLFLFQSLYAQVYDCVVVGTSPIPLFEALYQEACGHKVLILEASSDWGGAWKSIEVCGIPHVDMGCHLIGTDREVKEFLEEYADCSFITLDPKHGYYFTNGCYELIHNLQQKIEKSSIEVLTNHKIEWAQVVGDVVVLEAGGNEFWTKRIIHTPYCYFGNSRGAPPGHTAKFYHLYLLIADPTEPAFSYSWGIPGVTRMMNLTRFAQLCGTGRQLIAFQTHKEEQSGEVFLDELKKKKLVGQNAYILRTESYTYEQYSQGPAQHPFFEKLQTNHLSSIKNYIPRWKECIHPSN